MWQSLHVLALDFCFFTSFDGRIIMDEFKEISIFTCLSLVSDMMLQITKHYVPKPIFHASKTIKRIYRSPNLKTLAGAQTPPIAIMILFHSVRMSTILIENEKNENRTICTNFQYNMCITLFQIQYFFRLKTPKVLLHGCESLYRFNPIMKQINSDCSTVATSRICVSFLSYWTFVKMLSSPSTYTHRSFFPILPFNCIDNHTKKQDTKKISICLQSRKYQHVSCKLIPMLIPIS